jgi:hypothetical protein
MHLYVFVEVDRASRIKGRRECCSDVGSADRRASRAARPITRGLKQSSPERDFLRAVDPATPWWASSRLSDMSANDNKNGKINDDMISQVLNVRVTSRIFSCTLRSAVHSKCTCSRVSSRLITANRAGLRGLSMETFQKGGAAKGQSTAKKKKVKTHPRHPR